MEFRKYWNSRWWDERIKPTAQRIANQPRAEVLLFLIELVALLLLPIPVVLILVALVTAAPQKWWRFALSASAGSTLASLFLFLIGRAFFASFGERLLSLYSLQSGWTQVLSQFDGTAGVSIVLFAGLTSGLTRVVCLAAGFTGMNPALFVGLMVVSRTARFLTEGALIKYFGEKALQFPGAVSRYMPLAFLLLLLLVMFAFVLF